MLINGYEERIFDSFQIDYLQVALFKVKIW